MVVKFCVLNLLFAMYLYFELNEGGPVEFVRGVLVCVNDGGGGFLRKLLTFVLFELSFLFILTSSSSLSYGFKS